MISNQILSKLLIQFMPKQTSSSFKYQHDEAFVLEGGGTLQNLTIRYTTIGSLDDEKSNVVWVFHALTGNSEPVEWWSGLFGEGRFFDPSKYFIICANMIGSCYGSTEPVDFEFPLITIRDQVRAFKQLKEHLGIPKVHIGIGGSMGGQQLLQWAVQDPELFEIIIPIATNAKHSPWGIAFNETQRMAIELDPEKGIETARAIAMLSYRHYATYENTQSDTDARIDKYSASSYQQYQGQKLSKRFSPFSYYTLSKAMDSHNIGKDVEVEIALQQIQAKAIVIGIDSDILFPLHEQELLAKSIRDSAFFSVSSNYGHDGFLVETAQISRILENQL